MGAENVRIMFFGFLNNAFPPLIIMVNLMMRICILAEAGLICLGLGIAPPEAAGGSLVNDGYRYLLSNLILSLQLGLAVMIVVFACNMMGDGLRDALDPVLRGKLYLWKSDTG